MIIGPDYDDSCYNTYDEISMHCLNIDQMGPSLQTECRYIVVMYKFWARRSGTFSFPEK